jgi:hypothetical protein
MIQQAFEFGPVGEKPKLQAAQRKPTQRPTAARAKPAYDKKVEKLQATIKKLTESNKTWKELSDVLHNAHMRSMIEVRGLKSEISSLRLQNALLWEVDRENSKGSIPADMLARLIRLCHPDRHSNSPASNEMTSWLLSQRKGR